MNHLNPVFKTLARNGWHVRHGLCILACVAAAIALTWPAWIEMAGLIIRHDYARPSILVLPVMGWLVWVRRARFRFVEPGGPGVGLVVLVSGLHLYFVGEYAYDLRSVRFLGAVLVVASALLLCTGKSIIRPFLPAWAILVLLIPVPATFADLIARPIQVFEAQAIAGLYRFFGISVELLLSPVDSRIVVGGAEGTVLLLDSVCKGLPTMMSLMLISYGFVFGSPMRPMVRAVLLLITPAIALFCSAVSLSGTLWLYDGGSTLMTADLIRALSDWVTLLLAFLVIAGSLKLLGWASVPIHQYHLASSSS